MMCCIGLIIGGAVGSYLGGVWIFILPAIGFILGLAIDTKLMSSRLGRSKKNCCPLSKKKRKG